MRTILFSAALAIAAARAFAGPSSGSGTVAFGPATYTIQQGPTEGLSPSATPASVSPGSYDIFCNGTCTVASDANGFATLQGSLAPEALISFNPGNELGLGASAGIPVTIDNATAIVTYSYEVLGLPSGVTTTPGTIAVNLLAQASNPNRPFTSDTAVGQVQLDNSAVFAACTGPAPVLGGFVSNAAVDTSNCANATGSGTYNVTLQAVGQVTLTASATAFYGDTVTALADPVLTSSDGYTIVLSDGVANATIDAPEPASLAVLGSAAAALVLLRQRRAVSPARPTAGRR